MGKRFSAVWAQAVAVLCCAAVAWFFASLSRAKPWQVLVPVLFAVLVFALAIRFGKAVAVLGCVIGALVFAYFLYPPLYSFRVESEAARRNLAWMLLAVLVLSHLLLPLRAKTSQPATSKTRRNRIQG
jgi:K+-sensing histidine kinase KdpD